MLARWEFDMMTAGGQKPSIQWGRMLHGFFIKLWPGRYAKQLHDLQNKPFSQYVECFPDGHAIWYVHLFGTVFDEMEVEKTLSSLSEIDLISDHFMAHIKVTARRKERVQAKALWEKLLRLPDDYHICQIRFKTPSTHKSQGEYLKFPSPMKMLDNLDNRVADIFKDLYGPLKVDIEALGRMVRIRRYSLHTAPYYIWDSHSGHTITTIVGYEGILQLDLPEDTMMRHQAHLLLGLSQYIGIGIKTALGMGAVEIEWLKDLD